MGSSSSKSPFLIRGGDPGSISMESGTAICRAVVEAAAAQGDDDRRVAWGERTCDGGAGVSGVEMVSVGGEIGHPASCGRRKGIIAVFVIEAVGFFPPIGEAILVAIGG